MNTLTLFNKLGLTNNNYNYMTLANAFVSTGYTSMAGNTYFNSLWIAEGILIKEDIGQGYRHAFLNGLKIYSIKDQSLLVDQSYHNVQYSKEKVHVRAKDLLLDMLKESARKEGYILNIEEAGAKIDALLQKGIKTDQNLMLVEQSKKYLLAS